MYKRNWTVSSFFHSSSSTAVWKYLLAIVALQLVLAFVSFAIVRAGTDRELEDDDVMEGVDAKSDVSARVA
ncbi:hypothetical protein WM40_22250 [Robbsia andropogonis]|uniref:Uncharacterized protein n=1 Tax=Robbsia andropogonis TaxID=28092 RepID=A0A0F5JVE6_9BURK|nr:hypothetical protein WM40_22250 [Robbsia andropogonis]